MGMRKFGLFAVASSIMVGVGSYAGPVVAAPPGNDTQAGAVAISGVPFLHTQDTTEATVDASEDVARDFCSGVGAPAFEHAVWFSATVTGTSAPVIVDVSQSSYGAGIAVLQDTGSGLVAVGCVPRTFISGGGAPPGTYYFVVFGDGTTPETGGELVFSVDAVPPPPVVELSVDPVGRATKEGGAWISGTVTCTGGGSSAQILFVEGQVTQTVGRFIVTSFFSVPVSAPCDGNTHAWQAYAPPIDGKFAGGKAAVVTFSVACNPIPMCGDASVEAQVKLTRARN
jgi:hypothetical protein